MKQFAKMVVDMRGDIVSKTPKRSSINVINHINKKEILIKNPLTKKFIETLRTLETGATTC